MFARHQGKFYRIISLPTKQFNWQECEPLLGAALSLSGLRLLFSRQRNLNIRSTIGLRKMTSITQLQSAFLTRKASPNILVHFHGCDVSSNDERLLLEKMGKAIEVIYGRDRFVLYRIKEAELAFDSKIYSASALLIVTTKASCESIGEAAAYRLNIPLLHLDLKLLFPNAEQFDLDYFSRQIQTCISQLDHRPHPTSPHSKVDHRSGQCGQMFLFASDANYEKWSQVTRLKGIDLIECTDDAELPECASPNDVLFVDCHNSKEATLIKWPNFNAPQYFDHLQTSFLGRSVLFADKCTSTMDLADRLKSVHGLVAVTNCQMAGIGRNNNKWLSPPGCAMFTVNFQLNASSGIFARISLIQHLVSLSIVLALPSQLNIRIKWPNDVLFVDSMSKLAGILVRSFLHGNMINVQIGLGLNLSNRQPSVCLDDIIQHYNSQLAPGIAKIELITKETLVAKILNQLESLFRMLEQGRVQEIKQLYCANWIHSNLNIEVHDNNKPGSKRNAVICGIDDSGYLLAADSATGEHISLQPDGNRFDLMHRLVILNC